MDLEELRAFLAVAETGSFLTAAKALRQSRATIRRRVDQLEARAGVPLLDRTRLGALLTEAGKVLAGRTRVLVEEMSAVLQSVREVGSEPSGVLRIMLPVGLPPHLLTPLFDVVHRRYPRLTFRLHFSDDPAGELLVDVDLACHFGLESPPGPWISREVTRLRVWLVASAEYLQRRGTPRSIEELAGHDLLAWEAPGEDGRMWPMRGGGSFLVKPLLITRHIHLIRQFMIAGQGIALVPDAMVADPGVAAGALVAVLPDVVGREVGLRVVVPTALSEIPRIRALLDLLSPFMGEVGL